MINSKIESIGVLSLLVKWSANYIKLSNNCLFRLYFCFEDQHINSSLNGVIKPQDGKVIYYCIFAPPLTALEE